MYSPLNILKPRAAGAGLVILVAATVFCMANAFAQDAAVPVNAESASSVAQTSVSTGQEKVEAAAPGVPADAANQSTSPAAATPYYPKGATAPGSGGHLISVTFALLLIIALIMGLSWFVKRFGQGGLVGSNHLKIVASLPLGTRERIALIEVGGRQLLLGITPTQINTLHVLDSPVVASSSDPGSSEFSRKLMAILQRTDNTSSEAGRNNNFGPQA